MKIKKKVSITLDERFTLNCAQDMLIKICELIGDKDKCGELSELYHAAEEAYQAIDTIYNYVEEDYT